MSDTSVLTSFAGGCPVTGEPICRCGLKEDDPDRTPVTQVFKADDEAQAPGRHIFVFNEAAGTSTTGNDGFLLSNGNEDRLSFIGGDDVVQNFEIGTDVLDFYITDGSATSVSTASDFLDVIAATSAEETSPLEAYICKAKDGRADLVFVVRDADGVAQHSIKLIGTADDLGVQALIDAGAIPDTVEGTAHAHDHDGGAKPDAEALTDAAATPKSVAEPASDASAESNHGGMAHDHGTGDLVIEDNDAFLMAMGDGSRIEIHAADAAKDSWTQLSQTAMAGDRILYLAEDTGWEVGDMIAIAPSGREAHEDEVRTIIEVLDDGGVLLDVGLDFDHNGTIESFSDGTQTWNIDMRAEVALLSRNVTIQGDADSTIDGFGAHTMIMHGAAQHISGVEFTRVGQEDILGRYPIHWHMLGEDGAGQYVQNVSIHQTYQKGSTIHGTSNVLYQNNVIFDHVGHGVFFEDGSETGNSIIGNLVFGTKRSETGLPIPTDKNQASSYWIENASNTFIGNHAAGGEGDGFFLAPAKNGPHGLSAEAFPDAENDLYAMVFEGNVAHSYNRDGFFADGFVDHETLEWRSSSIGDGKFMMEDYTAYSNGRFGFWFRGGEPIVDNAKLADNRRGSEFHTSEGILSNSVVVGDTENVADVTGSVGIRLYRTGDTGFDDVHFANISGEAISQLELDRTDKFSWLTDVTFDDVERVFDFRNNGNEDGQNETRYLDLDGSLTGTPGTWITQKYDEGTPQTAGFSATEGSDFLGEVWLSQGDSVAATVIRAQLPEKDAVELPEEDEDETDLPMDDMMVTRSDGMQFTLTRGNDPGQRDFKQFITHTPSDGEAAYLIEFASPPSNFRLSVEALQIGEAVTYQFANIADFTTQNGFNLPSVDSLTALFASDMSATLLKDGNLFVRIVAVAPEAEAESFSQLTLADNPAGQYIGDEGARFDGLRFNEVVAPEAPVAFGSATFDPDLMVALANTTGMGAVDIPNLTLPEGPTPHEIHASTSDTKEVTDAMPRWSSAEVWPDGVPGADDIVVIGDGVTVVLDTSVTVKGIIIDGGDLIVEDAPGGPDNALKLVSDYVLVINGGLFQAGTEDDPLDRDFTLELTGDNPDNDIYVSEILEGGVAGVTFAEIPPVDVPVVLVDAGDPHFAARPKDATQSAPEDLSGIRDFDGNNLGAARDWKLIGKVDVQADGDVEFIFVNHSLGRWATVGPDRDGVINFGRFGDGGDTRIVGIYTDPLVASGDVEQGSDFDSQRRFQNDLATDNLTVIDAFDFDGDGFQEVYFQVNDGSAFLRALMHADGNIQYANYQNAAQVEDYLTSQGFGQDVLDAILG